MSLNSPNPPSPDAAGPQTVWLYQAQKKIYPRAVSGWFASWRWALVVITQVLFYGLAWLPWRGRQAVLFDLANRRFYIFDLVFFPQDFIYLTALLLLSAYGLFLFTAIGGRLWCGYACPQTVYSELFLWIERRCEGDRAERIRLDAAPWGLQKWGRKGAKQVLWVTLALWTGFTFVGYFTPIRVLADELLTWSLGPWEAFWILFYALATYGNAGYLREQVCKYMCPYARFQSAMFDPDTLIVSYDSQRGEPRGAKSKSLDRQQQGLGDCIDCKLCVQVCPTGIDIRKGLQYECIGCAACVDVCDSVMDRMGFARGLVRYDTQRAVAQGLVGSAHRRLVWARVLRPRVLVYGAVLLAISSAVVWSLWNRPSFRADVVRDRASLARVVGEGEVENVYRLQLMNVSEQPARFRVSVEAGDLPGLDIARLSAVGRGESQRLDTIEVEPVGGRWVSLALRLPAEPSGLATHGAHVVHLRVQKLGPQGEPLGPALREKTTFVLPR